MAQSHEEGTEQQGWIKTLSHCHHCHSPLPTAQPFVCIVHCASVRCTGYSIICAQKLPRPRSSNLLCIHYPIISISISIKMSFIKKHFSFTAVTSSVT